MENLKKYKKTSILFLIALFLVLLFLILPSKDKIKEIEIKTIETNITMIDIQSYYVKNNSLKEYSLSIKEDSYTNLIISAVDDILEKSKLDKNKLSLLNTYFSDSSVYLKFNNKNLDPLLKEAIQRTLVGFLGDIEVKFI